MTKKIDGMVSIIVPVYNRAKLLTEAVESALAQDYRPIEILIIDDGSTDETWSVAQELAQRWPDEIRVLRQENGGPGRARETGRLASRGEFIQHLDSDDLLLPGKLRAQVKALRDEPHCGVAYGLVRLRGADGIAEPHPWKWTGEKIGAMFPAFLVSRWWSTCCPLYRASVCEAAGPWTDLRLEEDWEYDCRIAALGTRLAFCPQYVSEHRDHAEARLSRGHALDPSRLASRAIAHLLIYSHAVRAGIETSSPEMQHYARELFLLARQCGAAGLGTQSRELFETARKASGDERANGLDFRLYSAAAMIFGWPLVGRLACASDHLRR